MSFVDVASKSFRVAAFAIAASASAAHMGAWAQSAGALEDSVIFNIPGGPGQDILGKCIQDDFTRRTKVRVDFVSAPSSTALARVMAQAASPTMDIVFATDLTNYTGIKRGAFAEVDMSLIPNFANVDPRLGAKPSEGALASASIQGITYNTKVFAENGWPAPKSWRDLWDPKYKGRVGIYGLRGGSGPALLGVAGYLEGKGAEDFDTAFKYIAKLKPNLYGTIFDNGPQFDVALKNGDVIIGIGSQTRALSMKLAGDPVSFVQPAEGIVVQNIFLSLVKGAPHPKAAVAFIDWMLSKEAQQCLPKAGYPSVISGIAVDPDLAPYLTIQQKVIPTNPVELEEKLPSLLTRWNKEIAG